MPLRLPSYIQGRTRARHSGAYLVVDPPVFYHPARRAEITFRIWGSREARQEGGVPVHEQTIEVSGAQYTALVNAITGLLETAIRNRVFPDAEDAT